MSTGRDQPWAAIRGFALLLHFPLYLASGLAITAGSEWLNVHTWKEWAYGPAMPVIAGLRLWPWEPFDA